MYKEISNYCKFSHYSLNQAFHEWEELPNCINKFNNPVMATFTFKKALTTLDAISIFTEFSKRASKAIYKSAYHRYNKRLLVFPVLEGFSVYNGYTRKNLHYHCIFATPTHLNSSGFGSLLKYHWEETHDLTGKQNVVTEVFDLNGCYEYINKTWSKNNLVEAIDINNIVLKH